MKSTRESVFVCERVRDRERDRERAGETERAGERQRESERTEDMVRKRWRLKQNAYTLVMRTNRNHNYSWRYQWFLVTLVYIEFPLRN